MLPRDIASVAIASVVILYTPSMLRCSKVTQFAAIVYIACDAERVKHRNRKFEMQNAKAVTFDSYDVTERYHIKHILITLYGVLILVNNIEY